MSKTKKNDKNSVLNNEKDLWGASEEGKEKYSNRFVECLVKHEGANNLIKIMDSLVYALPGLRADAAAARKRAEQKASQMRRRRLAQRTQQC